MRHHFSQKLNPERYPFPYLSALAVTNDCEFQTEKAFRFFERELTSAIGLRIPISHSLFFFATHASCHSSLGYFEGLTKHKSRHAGFLKELIQNESIDTIHAYGDFDKGGFERRYAEWVVEEIERENLKLPIYSNHGSNLNFQNMGHEGLTQYQQGDNPTSGAYHADLLDRSGVEFYWVDDGIDFELTSRDSLIYEQKCRDKKARTFFYRYRGLRGLAAPNAGSLPTQITAALIYELIQTRSAIIIYQHLGVLRKNPDGTFVENSAPFFSPDAWAVWRLVADKFRSNEIWLTTAANLLRFDRVRASVHARWQGTAMIITALTANARDLLGLWFRSDRVPESVRLTSGESSVNLPFKVIRIDDGFAVLLGDT